MDIDKSEPKGTIIPSTIPFHNTFNDLMNQQIFDHEKKINSWNVRSLVHNGKKYSVLVGKVVQDRKADIIIYRNSKLKSLMELVS